jgi:uncharacterized protein
MNDRTRRLRDPIHGLIEFDGANQTDMLAWRLIQAPEFQRLRRIRQLGVSEFVFPGATHTRFAHSVGVYHNARRLMRVVRRAVGKDFDGNRAQIVLIAALLHDIGHGPFSHAFEVARKAIARNRSIEIFESHEKFTARLILAEDGGIKPILNEVDPSLAEQISRLISADDPVDIYHAVVSSSFDADRLDYLLRDRYMTGTEAGSIDYDWLIDNLEGDEISVPQDDDEPQRIPTFVFKLKGRQAAEDFLLARFRLYTQVYLHKTTRGFEQLITALVRHIGMTNVDADVFSLDDAHPLIRFLKPNGGSLVDYRDLDDTVVWGALERLRRCDDAHAVRLAERLWNRRPLRVLDILAEFGHDGERMHNARRRLDEFVQDKLGITVFRDEPSYNLYSRSAGEVTKAHKMVRVRTDDGGQKEITEFPDTVISLDIRASRHPRSAVCGSARASAGALFSLGGSE